ncbi:DUF5694 domain-containing protein [Aestuariibacter salexigens]|uniref:DUF5694 domain-containing protein n=1 Tax=Aestuariibacter salexigens TaxID=226010 RepID=UPI000425FE6C|nr:DUF5694 domain-containing protein [Aestuariibacter salexigens]
MNNCFSHCRATACVLWIVSLLTMSFFVAAEQVLPGSPLFSQTGVAPSFNFAGTQTNLGGQPTRILVLGTTHLAQLDQQSFHPSHLSLVNERLAQFAPDVIAIESINGRACDEIQRYEALYPNVQGYCSDTTEALQALKLSRPEAAARIEQMRDAWPDAPSSSERRRLAMLYYAAGETWSGILQWAMLTEEQRIAEDGVTESMLERFNRGLSSRNENNLIGVTLAKRLGIEQLSMMDDHTADYIYLNSPEELLSVIKSVWNSEHPRQQYIDNQMQMLSGSAENLLKQYLFINSKSYQRFTIENDFGLATAWPERDGLARQYVAWWQVRGLRMVANTLEAAANHPGARVLVITGASHKAYFESYLNQMHDVELVSVDAVLNELNE